MASRQAHDSPSPGVRQGEGATDVAALLLEVARNERAMIASRLEYTWTAKVTEREAGRNAKQTVKVYEVYPVRGEFVRKLVSEDGVAIPPEQAEKEFQRAVKALEKAEREASKSGAGGAPTASPVARNPSVMPSFGFSSGFKHRSGFSSGEVSFAVWRFFRYGEFQTPRRERRNERDTIVLDFRPRADFRPDGDVQKPYAQLAGRVWIDAAEKTVVRLEAWPVSAGKKEGVSPASTQEPPVVFEHTRVADGVWLERLVRINTGDNPEVFNGVKVDFRKEVGDFQRFSTKAGEDKLEAPPKP